MAIGKKTQATPEIGDLATMGSGKSNFVFEDYNADTHLQTVPAGANLGAITEIRTNADDIEMYHVENGWVYADEVTTKVNPVYNYGTEAKTTSDNSKGFWEAFNNVFNLGVGLLTKKKTTTDTGNTETDTAQETEDKAPTEEKSIPTWVWWVGGLGLGGLVLVFVWPKTKKQPEPQQPIIIGK